jgi:serine O-acetyltransferase
MDFKTTIRADLFRYCGSCDRAAFWKAFREAPGFRFTYFLRKCQAARHRPRWLRIASTLVHSILLNHYRYKYGFEIPIQAEIGPGLYIGHFGHLTIHPECRLGWNVNLSPGVVIGQTNRGRKQGVPVLGDCVWIGSNAVVVGAVTVGDHVMIAPGAYVNFDVPDNAVVAGNPGQIVSYSGTEHYVVNIVDHI